MTFATPLGLLALLSVPVILTLHLFRRRYRERRVAGLFLFAPDALRSQGGRRRTRLLRTVSLWLEILAAVLLSLWLAGLSLGPRTAPTHLVLVLDDSASMAARGPAGSTAERVRSLVKAMLAELSGDGTATIVLTGPRPEILVGPRAPKAFAEAALEEWRPARIAHDPVPALELGLDLAEDGDRLCWVTDRATPAPPPRYRHVALGEPVVNAAVVSARRTRTGETERVFVDVRAWGPGPVVTRVRLTAGAGGELREIATHEVTAEPGRTHRLTFTVPASTLPLTARLAGDALAEDNEVLLLPRPLRPAAVFSDLGETTDRALRIERVLAVLPGVTRVRDPRNARLVLTTVAGVAPRGATELVLAADGEARDDWIGPFLMERRRALGGGVGSALLAGVSLEGVIWSAGRGALPGLPLISAGESALLSEEILPGGGVRLRLNLDPARSNLGSSPDWPIFLSNVVEQTRDRLPGPVAVDVRVGEEIAYRFAGVRSDVETLSLVDPHGERRPARGVGLLTWEARRPGLHRLVRDETVVARYGVSFVDPAESDLTGRGEIDVPEAKAPIAFVADVSGRGRVEGRVLALLLLLAVAADWFVLRRNP